jgi:hypothetical protein
MGTVFAPLAMTAAWSLLTVSEEAVPLAGVCKLAIKVFSAKRMADCWAKVSEYDCADAPATNNNTKVVIGMSAAAAAQAARMSGSVYTPLNPILPYEA